ncbi:aspartyl-phosphate phosphatase Spo0E family protein [Neobacillus pocheonensis]|uniref:aspartyl-phosphate phosphatase Spo0E family protein n=1 Tax=Neobacillus pocheonensis TaxID=363869 RepID=UPI003D2A52C8
MTTGMKSLLSSIEKTRLEMIYLAHKYGYSNPSVVKCSQKLDLLLNTYNNTMVKQ